MDQIFVIVIQPLVPGQEFGALQTSLLKHNRRLKQRDSSPLNAARGAGGLEVPQCGSGAKLAVLVDK